jgi:hypothetical protein
MDERTKVGDYELDDRQRHTKDRRFRIDPVGSGDLAVVVRTDYGYPIFHRTSVDHCLAWVTGYDAASDYFAEVEPVA